MSVRTIRLGDEIRDVLARCFVGEQLRDPRLQGVSITHVRVTADLQSANVYYRLFDPTRQEEAKNGLYSCAGYLRKTMAEKVKIRKIPELHFFYDKSIEEGSNIESLLEKIRKES